MIARCIHFLGYPKRYFSVHSDLSPMKSIGGELFKKYTKINENYYIYNDHQYQQGVQKEKTQGFILYSFLLEFSLVSMDFRF